jgi:hypothetical protein
LYLLWEAARSFRLRYKGIYNGGGGVPVPREVIWWWFTDEESSNEFE